METKSVHYVNDLQDVTNACNSISVSTEKKFSAGEKKICDFCDRYENLTESQIQTDSEAGKRSKRTRPEDSDILPLPDRQATITARRYTTTISFCQNGKAYMELFKEGEVDRLSFQNGRLYLKDSMNPLPEDEIQNMTSKSFPDSVDLSMLRTFYSVILKEYEKVEYQEINSNIVLYVPELLKALGKKGNQSQEQINKLINDMNQYKNVVGVVEKHSGQRVYKNRYALLNFNYYDQEHNTISFNAPYLEYIIKQIHENAIQRDGKGNELHSRNGKPFLLPTHSYLIKTDITKERNHIAVENVNIIVTLIEQAGRKGAHINAQTVLNRNPLLKQRLNECAPKNRQQILDRTFKKTWELLRSMTDIEEAYPGIVLPEPNNPDAIPKVKTLKTKVWEIRHNGKRKNAKNSVNKFNNTTN